MNIQNINNAIEPQKKILLQHPLYKKVKTIEDLKSFLENHVFAVWDFMSLLKALQSKLTCTTIPWFATKNPETRYLINEIVLAEESDLTLDGRRQSHYEMYIEAMQECGASTLEIESFLAEVNSLQNIFVAIKTSNLHPNIKSFLDFTFSVIEQGKPHEIADERPGAERCRLLPAGTVGLAQDGAGHGQGGDRADGLGEVLQAGGIEREAIAGGGRKGGGLGRGEILGVGGEEGGVGGVDQVGEVGERGVLRGGRHGREPERGRAGALREGSDEVDEIGGHGG